MPVAPFATLIRSALIAAAAALATATPTAAQQMQFVPGMVQALPDLRIVSAVGVPGQPLVRFQIVNSGRAPSAQGAIALLTSPLSARPSQLALPALRPGESRAFTIALPVDPGRLPPGANVTGTQIVLDIRHPGPEVDPNNRYAFALFAATPPPVARPAPPAPVPPWPPPTVTQPPPRVIQPPPRVIQPPSRVIQPPPSRPGPPQLAATLAPGAVEAAMAAMFPGETHLWWCSGGGCEFRRDVSTGISPNDQIQSVYFIWSITGNRRATGVLWQVSGTHFPPFAQGGPNDTEPQGLLASGYSPAFQGKREGGFSVNFGPLAEAVGLKRRPVRATQPSGQGYRIGSEPALPGDTAGGAVRRMPMGPVQTRAMDVAKFFDIGGAFPFLVRVVPVVGNAPPVVVAGPSNTILVEYSKVPRVIEPPREPTVEPGPRIRLIGFKYEPYRYEDRWPPGCKVWTPPKEENFFKKAFRFVADAWDFVSETYGKIKQAAVDLVDKLTPDWILPPTVISLAIDGALMAAGIPPDIPNIDELMQGGATYLATMAAEQTVGPLASRIPVSEAAGLIGNAAYNMGREELERRVKEEMRDRIEDALYDGAQAARDQFLKNAKNSYCTGNSWSPKVTLTLQNVGNDDYRDLNFWVGDGEVFLGNPIKLHIDRGQVIDIPYPPKAFIRVVQRSQLVGKDKVANERHWWNEIYGKIASSFEVRGPGEKRCTWDPWGMTCSTAQVIFYRSPTRVWNTAFTGHP